jgi:hypothetical protein
MEKVLRTRAFLLSRPESDKLQFLKNERDLCIEAYDNKLSEKK